jgi:S-adenosylmethionine:tRNA ribosyltransferase-isomerase
MRLSDFDYELPRELIAQRPLPERDASRLLVLDRQGAVFEDRTFRELPDLLRGDELLVVNNARVIPARLLGHRLGVHAEQSGRASRKRREFLQSPIEVLLTRKVEPGIWEALVRPGRKLRTGEQVVFGNAELVAEVIGRGDYGARKVRFQGPTDLCATLERLGHVPLPPYIDRPDEPADRDRYQTIFARVDGAVAAPTAGLHFTPAILERLRRRGLEMAEITLHVGPGTFQPIRTEQVEAHRVQAERYEISEAAATVIERVRRDRRPVLAVGTTVVRALEDAARRVAARRGGAVAGAEAGVEPGQGEADIFIYPGHRFRIVDQVVTNFHLPKSSLLVMVSAFAGGDLILRAYRHAIAAGYRFYSYGDCMLLR